MKIKPLLLALTLTLGFIAEAQSVSRTNVPPSISFAWNASPSPGITGYNFYFGPTARTNAIGNYTNVTFVGNVTSYTCTNLVRGATNYFSATAVAGTQESDYSNEVKAGTPPLPVAPSITVTGVQ